jgi:hypothetical protein
MKTREDFLTADSNGIYADYLKTRTSDFIIPLSFLLICGKNSGSSSG